MITKSLPFIAVTMCFSMAACTEITQDRITRVTIAKETTKNRDSFKTIIHDGHEIIVNDTRHPAVNTGKVSPESLVSFAETLIGTPYKYASADPAKGFDCSGFITFVFTHFKITVPRSSIDFTNAGTAVPLLHAKRGDIILFTGTDSTERFVGHMGIITGTDNNTLQFIHSTSGKANGVTVTSLGDYYKSRYIKVIRLFNKL